MQFLQFLPGALAQEYTRWNLPAGAILRLGKGITYDLEYSPDGTRLAVATSIGIWLYDAHTATEIALLAGHMAGERSVAFSPDSKTLASGSMYNTHDGNVRSTIRLWDVYTGKLKQSLDGHIIDTNAVAFSPDGNTLASGGFGEIRLWDTVTGKIKHTLEGHKYEVYSIAFTPDGKTPSLPAVTITRYVCGIPYPEKTSVRSRGTPIELTPWHFPRMVKSSPVQVRTVQSACGTPLRENARKPYGGT